MDMLLRRKSAHGLVLASELPAESRGAPSLVLLRDHGLEGDRRAAGSQRVQQGRGERLHDQHLILEAFCRIGRKKALQAQQISEGMAEALRRYLDHLMSEHHRRNADLCKLLACDVV